MPARAARGRTAYNLALQEATGTYFLCVDSDDLLVPDAMEALREKGILADTEDDGQLSLF